MIVAGDPAPETLPRIEKFVKEYNIQFAIHNHGPEDKIWHSPLDVLKVVKNMDPRMGCCIDVGHAARAGTDVVQAIHEVGPRLFDMHIKDLANFQSKDSQVDVGDGIMPIRGVFEALIAIKYKGFVDLEYEIHAEDPMPGVIEALGSCVGCLRVWAMRLMHDSKRLRKEMVSGFPWEGCLLRGSDQGIFRVVVPSVGAIPGPQ